MTQRDGHGRSAADDVAAQVGVDEPHDARTRLPRRPVVAGAATVAAMSVLSRGVRAAPSRLPAPRTEGTLALERALALRRSERAFAPAPLALADVAQLAWAAQGLNRPREGLRTAPSAGALYPLALFVAAGAVEGLDPGVSRYSPADHRLEAGRVGDVRAAVADATFGAQRWIAAAAAVFVLAADPRATSARYGPRADLYVALETGAAMQNLLLQAAALGLAATPVGAFREAALREALALPRQETPLLMVPVGRPVGR